MGPSIMLQDNVKKHKYDTKNTTIFTQGLRRSQSVQIFFLNTHHFDGWFRIRLLAKRHLKFYTASSPGNRQGRGSWRQKTGLYKGGVMRMRADAAAYQDVAFPIKLNNKQI